ncbi:hypothetical protein KHA80_13320 [Anaerobacillus sp. HL2]|nr:hypothetical protein KHA80_13320 [Anaerobacillus sp. HL2]
MKEKFAFSGDKSLNQVLKEISLSTIGVSTFMIVFQIRFHFSEREQGTLILTLQLIMGKK